MTPEERLMTALYAEHHDVLLAFVLRYTSDRGQAEDVVQESLLRAWRNIDHLDLDRGTPLSYLFTVARNILTDVWRAEQRRPRLVSDEALIAMPTSDEVDAAINSQLVAAALERLSVAHREVIRALYYDGLTVAEAARRLLIPEGTVKSRAYYAVRALRSAFEELGVLR